MGILTGVAGEPAICNKRPTRDSGPPAHDRARHDAPPIGRHLDAAATARPRHSANHLLFRHMIPLSFMEPTIRDGIPEEAR